MTLEEKARQRAEEVEKNQTLGVYDNDEDLARDSAFNDGFVEGYEEGYLAGAKENGVVWHDLRKDPNDLPKDNHTYYLVYLDWLGKKYELLRLCEIKTLKDTVIAWCEIPQFKE